MNGAEPKTPDGMVDGATGQDDGGREEGDIELALFKGAKRGIRTISRASSRLRLIHSPGNNFSRYFQDPLSMFSAERAAERAAEREAEREAEEAAENQSHSQRNGASSAETIGDEGAVDDQTETQLSESNSSSESCEEEDDETSNARLQRYVSHGVAWRDAMVQACAELLGKSVPDLEREYHMIAKATDASSTAFSSETRSFEPTPRDFGDYVIMTTLKVQDSFAMQNATSWLFNMMDRTGAGYVLRDEFIRYAPFIGPVADAAVAGLVFDALVLEQARLAAEKEHNHDQKQQKADDSQPDAKGGSKEQGHGKTQRLREGLRRRRPDSARDRQSPTRDSSGRRTTDFVDAEESTKGSTVSNASAGDISPSRDLYPPALALRFDTWRQFFLAIQDKHNYEDHDWENVKQQVGIDPGEVLIKSQGALDHSDIFPTLGKLFLSQRYLIFFAAVGRNHYVARLGAIAEVTTASIPIMMRDCIQVRLESEVKAAMDGISAQPQPDPAESGSSTGRTWTETEADTRQEPTLSQHIGKLMRQYSAGRKPLTFSLLELRETKRRDNWMNLTREMIAAHKLHVQLGFGSSGRAVPSISKKDATDLGSSSTNPEEDNESNEEVSKVMISNYAKSPFRNEPSPPLLAVAAHANIVRYRALRRVTGKRASHSLLLFSHAQRNTPLINWYTDSVRAYGNQNGRTWVERALAAIRENMDTNKRMYEARDDEPFDVGRLGDAIGRFAELCSPLARVIRLLNHLFQWRNPPATILAILVCIAIATNGLVHYVPASLFFIQAAWIVETKYNWLGLGMGRMETGEAERRQANVLALVAQVHDTLAAAQNVLGRLNNELGKVQLLFLWGLEEWQSWVAVGVLCGIGFVLMIIPAKVLFLFFFFLMFFKHFLPPSNPGMRFWQSLPGRLETRHKESRRQLGRRKRKLSNTRTTPA